LDYNLFSWINLTYYKIKNVVNHFRFQYTKYPKYRNNKTLNWYVGTFIYINIFISSILLDHFLRHYNFHRFRYSIISHVHYTEYIIIRYYHFSLWFSIDLYQFYYYLYTFTSYCHLNNRYSMIYFHLSLTI